MPHATNYHYVAIAWMRERERERERDAQKVDFGVYLFDMYCGTFIFVIPMINLISVSRSKREQACSMIHVFKR